MNPSKEEVVRANREIYDELEVDEYEKHDGIFHPKRQAQFRKILASITPGWANSSLLDIGSGTGNIPRLAKGMFTRVFGIDISLEQLKQLKDIEPEILLSQAEAGNLPFRDNTFDVCTCCSVLHHLHSHDELFSEVHRVLRPGGFFYTDHDPNYYFRRFFCYYLRFRGFDFNSRYAIAEYHQYSGGLNPDALAEKLRAVGFSDVEIHYRITENPSLNTWQKVLVKIFRIIETVLPFKSFKTHFALIARKSGEAVPPETEAPADGRQAIDEAFEGVHNDLLNTIVCPKCQQQFNPRPNLKRLSCTTCNLDFEVRDGIPSLDLEYAKPLTRE